MLGHRFGDKRLLPTKNQWLQTWVKYLFFIGRTKVIYTSSVLRINFVLASGEDIPKAFSLSRSDKSTILMVVMVELVNTLDCESGGEILASSSLVNHPILDIISKNERDSLPRVIYIGMTKSEFASIIKNAKNQSSAIIAMGRTPCGHSRRVLNSTAAAFSIDISHLKNRRSINVMKCCKECGSEFASNTTKKASNFCSKFCARKYSHSFVDIEQLTKTMNEKASVGELVPWNKGKLTGLRDKYTCFQCGSEFYQSLCESSRNKICVCSNKCRTILLPKVHSKNLLRQYKNGKKVYGGTTKWYQYKNVKVQGTYELRACKIFDAMAKGGVIAGWKYSPMRIEYVGSDGKTHNYIIDFRVDNTDGTFYFVETKGIVRENDELKWEAVRAAGYTLDVWFLPDIEKKEIEFLSDAVV